MPPYQAKRVVIPVDPTELPYKALEVASQIVGSLENAHLLAVYPGYEAVSSMNWGTIDGETREDYAARELQKRLADTAYAKATLTVVFGSPAAEIAKFAGSIDADLIVMPIRNKQGRLSRLVNGSVAEDLMRLAPCPVLVLPMNPDAKPEPVKQASGTPGHRGGW
jgi:nucleotide-binding universal stress UspA family protein